MFFFIFAGLNFFAIMYQISNANAIANNAKWTAQNILKVDLKNIVHLHLGDFSHYDPKTNFVVSMHDGKVTDVVHGEKISFLGYPIKSYVLIKKK